MLLKEKIKKELEEISRRNNTLYIVWVRVNNYWERFSIIDGERLEEIVDEFNEANEINLSAERTTVETENQKVIDNLKKSFKDVKITTEYITNDPNDII